MKGWIIMEKLNNENDDKIVEEFLKIISKEEFEETVTGVVEYFNGVVNKITKPELITVTWDVGPRCICEDTPSCAYYSFPYEIVICAESVIHACFDSVDNIIGKDDYVRMKLISSLIYVIVHELSHVNQRVDLIQLGYDEYRNDLAYRTYLENSNVNNSRKFLEENLDIISEDFGFEIHYNFDDDYSDAEYEPLTLMTYYREILELLLSRGFKSEESYNQFMDSFLRAIAYLNDNATGVKLIINDESLMIKEIDCTNNHIIFIKPDELNPFIYENFTRCKNRFVKADVSFEEKDDYEIMVIEINVHG